MKLLILILVFYSVSAQAKLKVAIVDAFFCKDLKSKNVVIKKVSDMTVEKNPYGDKCDDSRKYHGNKVAKYFLKTLNGTLPLELYLYKVFDQKGNQDPKALKAALLDIKQEKIDATIMAIGFFTYNELPGELPGLTLAAQGVEGNGVPKGAVLWPQKLENPHLVLFAHYFPSLTSIKRPPQEPIPGHIDPSILNLGKVDIFIPQPKDVRDLTGSSYAVAVGSAKLLKACFPLKDVQDCIKKHSLELSIKNSPVSKIFRTLN